MKNTSMGDRNGPGIVLKSKNKVFKPLLSNGGQSASIEEHEIFIPVKKSVLTYDDKKKQAPPVCAVKSRPQVQAPPQYSQKSINSSVQKVEPQNIPEKASIPYRSNGTASKIPEYSNTPKPKEKSNSGTLTQPKSIPRKDSSRVSPAKSAAFVTHRHIVSTAAFQAPSAKPKAVLSPHNVNRKVEETKVISELKKPAPKSLLSECRMSEEEKAVYGNRFPAGYQKVSLIGKGGCALVWLGKKVGSEIQVAIKQFAKSGSYKSKSDVESCKAEIEMGKILFHPTGVPKDNYKEYPGVDNVAAYLETIEDAKDIWIVYELGGVSLTKLLFDIKGEFFKGERLYKVTHQPFYNALKSDRKLFKKFIKKLLEALDLLQHHKIIHCDLKPDNLLVSYDGEDLKLKLIDFGSAFMYGQSGILRMATPEYMPPECLELMQSTTEGLENLAEKVKPWSVDVWSVGAILLEILTGFPQWLSLKGRVQGAKRSITGQGVFAVQGKVAGKIIQKQRETVGKIWEVLEKYNSFIKDEGIVELLRRMLDLNPRTRISPKEALKHPSLAYEYE